jgi:hypothetical protein
MQKKISINKFLLITVLSNLNGCAATEENLVSSADKLQVENTPPVKSIKIISVLPTKIEVDNSQAQFALGVSSAAARGIGGIYGGAGSLGTMGTTIEGGSIGNSTGLAIPDKVLVDGVSISYSFNEKTFTTSQPGRTCEFQPGTTVLLANDNDVNKTRIQPNASCPVEK